ncbi:MAG TPA: MBL fold metallo-hydrolase [Nitrolancea sp.]|jgi:pyrroloquinoline quinone biosynthesis protein B|nr:MBL fold metallo-hydrolase [Nitrolancea sp.]
MNRSNVPYTLVLGISQDGGYPQAGNKSSPAWDDHSRRRLAACIALVDPGGGGRWLFDATPDFKEQLHRLDVAAPDDRVPGLDAILLTHAHIGHYTGLIHLSRETIGSRGLPLYAMPRMEQFLRRNGPWEQLVTLNNVVIKPLREKTPVELTDDLSVTPLLVPHRDEYSETVAFRITGPSRSVLFLPDINGWDEWDAWGTRIEDVLATVDVAYLDGTFLSSDELPGRNLAEIPHPLIADSIARFTTLPERERGKIRFIHLNQSNPLIDETDDAHATLRRSGLGAAREGELVRI